MTATLTLIISGDADGDLSTSWNVEGFDDGDAPVIALTAVLGLMRDQITEALNEGTPFGNGEIIAQLADQAARIALMHEVTHLPSRPNMG